MLFGCKSMRASRITLHARHQSPTDLVEDLRKSCARRKRGGITVERAKKVQFERGMVSS